MGALAARKTGALGRMRGYDDGGSTGGDDGDGQDAGSRMAALGGLGVTGSLGQPSVGALSAGNIGTGSQGAGAYTAPQPITAPVINVQPLTVPHYVDTGPNGLETTFGEKIVNAINPIPGMRVGEQLNTQTGGVDTVGQFSAPAALGSIAGTVAGPVGSLANGIAGQLGAYNGTYNTLGAISPGQGVVPASQSAAVPNVAGAPAMAPTISRTGSTGYVVPFQASPLLATAGYAWGGGVAVGGTGMPMAAGNELRSGGWVQGDGDGKSDSITVMGPDGSPNKLSDGEFVITAPAVSHLGRGSNKAGAAALKAFMTHLEGGDTKRAIGALGGGA